MNIKFALEFGKTELSTLENPLLEAEVLLAEATHKDRVFFRMDPQFELPNTELNIFRDFISQRKQHIPVAQIIGYKIWHDFKIIVDDQVLIPRDETEILCKHITKSWKQKFSTKNPREILDIGTGSGIISLFMKQQFPDSHVMALDISESALNIAKQNSQNNSLNIDFKNSYLLDFLTTEPYKSAEKQNFDIIIANLPYVPQNLEVTEEVQKEPALAIFSGEDGLDLIRELRNQVTRYELSFQELWLEFLPTQVTAIQEIFNDFDVNFFPAVDSQEIFFAQITPFPKK